MDSTDFQLVRLKEVKKMLSLGRDTVFRMVARGEMPAPIKIGPRAIGWVKKELDEWISKKMADRKAGRTK